MNSLFRFGMSFGLFIQAFYDIIDGFMTSKQGGFWDGFLAGFNAIQYEDYELEEIDLPEDFTE